MTDVLRGWSDRADAPVRVPVREACDVTIARLAVRRVAARAFLSERATHSLATAVSEIVRNIVVHAGSGELTATVVIENGQVGVVAIARDRGPGIRDLDLAMQDGYSTAKGLGIGLPGARRLVHEFHVASVVNKGTIVTMKMWAR